MASDQQPEQRNRGRWAKGISGNPLGRKPVAPPPPPAPPEPPPKIPAELDPARESDGRWVKGKSGNPSGRPRTGNLTVHLNKLLTGKVLAGKPIPNGMEVGEFLAMNVIVRALQGDKYCTKALLDRFAPVVQQINLTQADADYQPPRPYSPDELAEITKALKQVGFYAADHDPLADATS